MSILDQAISTQDSVESIKALIYGDSGVGKTYFAGSGRNNGEKDLIIAIEHGTVSAARAGSKAKIIRPENLDQLNEIVDAVCDEPHRFDWVIVDSLTQMQDMIWEHIISSAVRANPHRSPYDKQLQEYGEAQERYKAIVTKLLGSDANVIFTALSETTIDEDGNAVKMPSIHGKQGALAMWTAAKPDIVGYLRVARSGKGKIYHRMEFNKSPEFYAKDRFGVFSKPGVNLTLETFTDKLLNAGAEDAPVQPNNKTSKEK